MNIGKHSLHYLIDTRGLLPEVQVKKLDIAMSEFFKKYEINPDCSVAAKLKSQNEIGIHPLKGGRADFNLKEKKRLEIKFGAGGSAILDATILGVYYIFEIWD